MANRPDKNGRIKGYAFVDSISLPNPQNARQRLNIVFDFITEAQFEAVSGPIEESTGLFVIRLMTTLNRLTTRFPDVDVVKDSWVRVTFEETEGEPRAWLLSADDDFNHDPIASNLVQMLPVSENELRRLSELCRPKDATRASFEQMLLTQQHQSSYHVRVVDVGQANFAAIHLKKDKNSRIIGYFDVGGPIFFHNHTFPKSFDEEMLIAEGGFVGLSHWDFDHYSLALTRMKALQNLNWFAPDQAVGPVASRLQTSLGSRLTLLNDPTHTLTPGIEFWKGSGTPTDRNNSGYALTVNGCDGKVLLTGDVSYHHIPCAAKIGLSALAVTHHGGTGAEIPPTPIQPRGVAAVSYGVPNRYHHPDTNNIRTHAQIGWNVSPTFDSSGLRGDVWLS